MPNFAGRDQTSIAANFATNMSARDLLNSLTNAGMMDAPACQQAESAILLRSKDKELPIFLRVLSGIGALVASLCFIGFLELAEIISFRHDGALLVWGAIFIGLAIFLAIAKGDKDQNTRHSFVVQLSLCAMGIGKIIFVAGFASFWKGGDWGTSLGLVIVTAATYYFYPMSIDRFLSSFAVMVSIMLNIASHRRGEGRIFFEVAMNLLFVMQLGVASILLFDGKIRREYIPIAYAAAFALCVTVVYLLDMRGGYSGDSANWRTFDLTFINAVLTLALIGLMGWASGNFERLKTEPLILASLGTLTLGLLSAPGVLLSLCLMVLGYAKHERLLLLLGVFLMPVVISHYYYSLDISLMVKSGILVGSGAVLLAGCAYIAVRKLDRKA